jgi:DNA-binding response OmpR family regulator
VYVNHLRKHLSGTNMQIIGVHGKGYRLVES